MSGNIHNIDLRVYRKFLKHVGCNNTRNKGGHEHWTRSDLRRPLTVQSHCKTVPMFIVLQHLGHLGIDRKEFIEIIKNL